MVQIADEVRVRTTPLNRPERPNTFSNQLVADLAEALQHAESYPELPVGRVKDSG